MQGGRRRKLGSSVQTSKMKIDWIVIAAAKKKETKQKKKKVTTEVSIESDHTSDHTRDIIELAVFGPFLANFGSF